ncbi:MAG: class I SAM-dependent methyltransferase, partial [Ignavibacteria bacterium]|nr:class I SAM-dependent methyltransferase [Ignavibacteria bacterium]
GELGGRVLDCGEPNLLKEMIQNRCGIQIESTNGDLDLVRLSGSFDRVLAFEVIEHLMNPLRFLLQVKSVLSSNGRLFISTPINKPKFLWREDHFHEFDEYRLEILLRKAGFHVVKKQIMRFYRITGVRPIIRYLSRSGTMFMELEPRSGS